MRLRVELLGLTAPPALFHPEVPLLMTRCHACAQDCPEPRLGPEIDPELSDFVCPSCAALQPPPAVLSHFQRLGLHPAVRISEETLSSRFRKLSRLLHPDRFAKKGARERRLALDHTTAINDAYRVLKDPVKRAEYLLSLRGVAVGEDRVPASDQAFLVEMMEMREEVDEARRDAATALAMEQRLSREIEICLGGVDELTRDRALDGASAAAAHRFLMRLKYLNSARNDLGATERQR